MYSSFSTVPLCPAAVSELPTAWAPRPARRRAARCYDGGLRASPGRQTPFKAGRRGSPERERGVRGPHRTKRQPEQREKRSRRTWGVTCRLCCNAARPCRGRRALDHGNGGDLDGPDLAAMTDSPAIAPTVLRRAGRRPIPRTSGSPAAPDGVRRRSSRRHYVWPPAPGVPAPPAGISPLDVASGRLMRVSPRQARRDVELVVSESITTGSVPGSLQAGCRRAVPTGDEPEVGHRRNLLHGDPLPGQPSKALRPVFRGSAGGWTAPSRPPTTRRCGAVRSGPRHGVVDNMGQLLDVQAAGGHVGRQQQFVMHRAGVP